MSHFAETAFLLGNRFSLLLSREETLFFSGPNQEAFGTWTGTNASLVAEETFRYLNEYNSLRVKPLSPANGPSGTTTFSITHENKVVPQTLVNDALVFHAFLYCLEETRVVIRLQDSNNVVVDSEELILPPLTWSLVKSEELDVTAQTQVLTARVTMNFTLPSGGNNHLHVAQPILTNSFGFTDNTFLRETINYLPRFLLEVDELQENPQFPMVRYMDVGLAYADRGYRQIESFRYRDISGGRNPSDPNTLSDLVDPLTADVDYLRWLGQFVGVTRTPARAGGTPWGNLPTTWDQIHTDIDSDADVTFFISSISSSGASLTATPTSINAGDVISVQGTTSYNGQYIVLSKTGNLLALDSIPTAPAETTGTITLVDNSWFEIESFDTQDSNYEQSQRNLITTQRTGLRAGTKQAIIDTLVETLLQTKQYLYGTNPVAFPWTIFIETLTSETPEGVNDVESAYLLSQLREVKPMGFTIHHRCRNVLGSSIILPSEDNGFVVYPQD